MEKIITTEAKPIKMWLNDIEDSALKQAKNLANLPFTFKHIALMPDCHMGYGMPIGGVLATKGVIIPNAVGVDIGCGMNAVQTSLKSITKEQLLNIMGLIREVVPLGFNHQSKTQEIPEFIWDCSYPKSIIKEEFEAAKYQLGTLGGGNHFIEIQQDTEGYIWIMIHSGSRNLGKKVGEYYNKIAADLNSQWYSKIEQDIQLSFLPLITVEGKAYFKEMQYCINFALANRKLIMQNIIECFHKVIPNAIFIQQIDVIHNYASMENHFGENVLVHRKGATYAGTNSIGIIPGSQGTKSYIVRGLGNSESFYSCSHGAGRKIGRKEAQKVLDLNTEKKLLDDQGIIHNIRNIKDLDEAASAYKDINIVMQNQKDLVKPIIELSPLAVIKG